MDHCASLRQRIYLPEFAKSPYQKNTLVAVFIFAKGALFLFMRTGNMLTNEIVNLIHEYAQDGLPLNLSKSGVKSLSDFLSWRPVESCPENKNVLLLVRGRGLCVGCLRVGCDPVGFCHMYASFGDCYNAENRNVTHWMPRPQPPAGSP